MEYKDYYRIMGVARDASQDEIKRAYRKLARKYHPDVSNEPDAEEKFKEVAEAYKVLKDPKRRQAYDQLGRHWEHGEEFHPPPNWEEMFDLGRAGVSREEPGPFSDFFESLFGRFHPGYTTQRTVYRGRGEDIYARLRVPLEAAYRGSTRTITLNIPEYDARGRLQSRLRTLKVHIPKGVKRGQHIRLAGEGGKGFGDHATPGDLFLQIDFESHPLFQVEGRNILLSLPVTPWEAALGAKVRVPTLGGAVTMTIPPGSQSGRRLRLKGRGLPGTPAGDQIVLLRIETPPADTEAAKQAYRRLAESSHFNPRAKLEAVT